MNFKSFTTEFNETIAGEIFPAYDSLRDHLDTVVASMNYEDNGLLAQLGN